MMSNPSAELDYNDLSEIRDAVPGLDLKAIRSLTRAGFKIVRQDADDSTSPDHHAGWRQEGLPSNAGA